MEKIACNINKTTMKRLVIQESIGVCQPQNIVQGDFHNKINNGGLYCSVDGDNVLQDQ